MEVEIFENGFTKKPQFGRKETFATDLEVLRKKYRGTKYEAYMHFMLDSLIIMEHARKHLDATPDPELDKYLQSVKEREYKPIT